MITSNYPVMIRIEAFTANSKKYGFYAKNGDLEYYQSKKLHQGQDKKIEKKQISQSKEFNYLNYMTRNNEIELFNDKGKITDLASSDLKVAKDSNIWSLVISLDDVTSHNNDIYQLASSMVKTTMDSLYLTNSKYGLSKENSNYVAAVHTDKDHHHHVHVKLFQKQGTPKEDIVERYKLNLQGLDYAKYRILRQLNGHRIDDFRLNMVTKKIKDDFRKTVYRDILFNKFDIKSTNVANPLQRQIEITVNAFDKIKNKPLNYSYRMLCRNVKKPITSNSPNQVLNKLLDNKLKTEIDKLTRLLIRHDPENKKSYNEFKNMTQDYFKQIAIKNKLDDKNKTGLYVVHHKQQQKRFDDMKYKLSNAVIASLSLTNTMPKKTHNCRKFKKVMGKVLNNKQNNISLSFTKTMNQIGRQLSKEIVLLNTNINESNILLNVKQRMEM